MSSPVMNFHPLFETDDEPVIQTASLHETDEEVIERLRFRFSVLDDMTRAVKKGHIRGMIVSGPPGVGKSFGVEKILDTNATYAALHDDPSLKKYEILKGSITALGLYQKLHEYQHPNCVLVLDDIDCIFQDVTTLNLLKSVLDSTKTRRVNWESNSNILKSMEIPKSFEFHGGVIFITNWNFDAVKSEKMKPHLAALESRSHYIDLSIKTDRDKILRIKQIIGDGMLDEYGFSDDELHSITSYVTKNAYKLRELSLRTVIKLAGLVKSFPDRWKPIADISILRE